MQDLEQSILASLDGSHPRLFPYLPELLQDLDDLGADAALVEDLLGRVPPLPAAARLLDLGCGKGSVSLHLLARHPWTGLGLDGMPDFVARARERAMGMGLQNRCRFEVADIRTWPGEGKFDVIVLGAVGPVLGEAEATLRHLDAWLASGGVVVMDEVLVLEGTASRNASYNQTRPDLEAAIRRAGFRVLAEAEEPDGSRSHEFQAMFVGIQARAAALAERHPEDRAILETYVASQAREFEILEHEILTVTLALSRA